MLSLDLESIRRRRGWSQRDLAQASGVAQATISRLEAGVQTIRPSTLRRLADALDVAPAELLVPAANDQDGNANGGR